MTAELDLLHLEDPTVILTVGVSGSGKSTWVREKLGHLNPVVCSADDFCVDLDGNYTWSHEVVTAAHAVCKRRFNEAVAAEHPLIVVDNTNLMHPHRQHYLDWARKHDYQCFMVVFDIPSVMVAAERNTHGVPQQGIVRQIARLDLKPGIYYIPVKPPTKLLLRHDAVKI